jgi:hypothetical protein
MNVSGELSGCGSQHVDLGAFSKSIETLDSFAFNSDSILVQPLVVLVDNHNKILAGKLSGRELVDAEADLDLLEVGLDLLHEL